MSVAEKLEIVAKNQKKVFEAGGLAYSPKGAASGEVVGITDISPIEHDLSVKLSSDTITDLSTTTLNVLGKNLFNNDTDLIEQQTFHNSSGTEYKRCGYKPLLLPKGTYTFSANLINTQTEGVHLYVYKVNANDILVGSAIYIANGTTLYTPTFTMDNGEKIIICNGDGASSISKTKKWFGWFNIQLEAGNGATPYESYCPTNYTPNADGTVEGVKSIYPNTTLTTDTSGVLIEAEYYQDGKKVKENLTNVILGLGGILND